MSYRDPLEDVSQITHVSFSGPSKTRISLIAYMHAVPLECECQDTIQNHRNVELISQKHSNYSHTLSESKSHPPSLLS